MIEIGTIHLIAVDGNAHCDRRADGQPKSAFTVPWIAVAGRRGDRPFQSPPSLVPSSRQPEAFYSLADLDHFF